MAVSRIARNPITVPSGVEVVLTGQDLKIKGKHGQLTQSIHPLVKVTHQDHQLTFAPSDEESKSNVLSGTMRALANNMVKGVVDGFEKRLVLLGVGYRAKAQGKILELSVGFSHPVKVTMPEGVTVETPSQTEITLKSANKQLLGQVAANIRDIRKPEPYKGKGIRYADEVIVLKEGKKK